MSCPTEDREPRHRAQLTTVAGETQGHSKGRHAAWTTIQNPTPEDLEELFGDAS